MKGFVAAAALAAMASGANAHNAHRQAHNLFKKSAHEACTPVCSTIVRTITGEGTWVPNPPPKPTVTPQAIPPPPPPAPTPETTEEPVTTKEPETTVIPIVPVPELSTCDGPGTYTIPAETMTVSDKVEVCGAASTHLPAGTHTIGEVTTECPEPTTVTYAVCDEINGGEAPQTTHVCPDAGVCTIVPGTVTVIEEGETDVFYPTVSVFEPGTYTRAETVVTVTVDKTVAYCPYKTSEKPKAPKPTKAPEPKPEPKPEPTTEAYKAPEQPKKPEQPKEEPKPSPKPAPKPSPKPEQPKEPKKPQVSGPGDTVNGFFGPSKDGAYAMTYTPYEASNGNCKSASGVMSDLTILKGMGLTTIRIYSTDCDTYKTVIPAAKKLGLKLVIGVFVKGSCSINSPDVKEQVDTIAAWADWSQVELIVVGNEVAMSGACSAGELVTLIKAVKSRCSGYKGPWTTAEILDTYEKSDFANAVCPEIDVVGANIHAFFNPSVSASGAGKFVRGQLDLLAKICPGKKAINLECGWPTNGDGCNGAACPGKKEAITALKSIKAEAGRETCFFSMYDDLWKDGGVNNVEKYWGCPREVFA